MDKRQLKEFGERVRRGREALNLTREAFCHKAGITRATLRQLEAGVQHPSPRTMGRLTKTLHIDEATLTGAQPIALDHPLLADLREEDLEVAQRFHHASTRIRMRILRLLDRAPASLGPARSTTEAPADRRRAPMPVPDAYDHEASAPIDPRVAAAYSELQAAETREKFVEFFLAFAKDLRTAESTRESKAGATQRSKRR